MKIDFRNGIGRARLVLADAAEARVLAEVLLALADGHGEAWTTDEGFVICLASGDEA